MDVAVASDAAVTVRTPALWVPLAPEKSDAEVVFTTIADADAVFPAEIALAERFATVPAAAAVPAEKFQVTVVCAPKGSPDSHSIVAAAAARDRRTLDVPTDASDAPTDKFRTDRNPGFGRANKHSKERCEDMVQDRVAT